MVLLGRQPSRDLASLAGGSSLFADTAGGKLEHLKAELDPLVERYDVVVANPPYMGSSNMNKWVADWAKKEYPNSKRDLCTCFIERGSSLVSPCGYIGMITASSWMFISSFEAFRKKLLETGSIISMIQQSTHGYAGVTVPTCMFVFGNHQYGIEGCYIRLEDFDRPQWQEPRALEALANPQCGWFYRRTTKAFEAIPGSPIGYWVSEDLWYAYENCQTFADVGHPKVGMQTSNNDKYLRLWWEIRYPEFSQNSVSPIWIKYLKGGDYRKWYGNLEYLLHYKQDPSYILQQPNAKVLDLKYLDKPKCTWTDLTSGEPSFRYAPKDTFYDISGHCFFPSSDNQLYLLAYANSSLVAKLKKVFNSSFHFQCGDLAKIIVPAPKEPFKRQVEDIAKKAVSLCQNDWNTRETSWDFVRHFLI